MEINEKNISQEYDRKHMFKRDSNYLETQWLDVEDEHFMVWMQMESFPTFRKLWGKIDNEMIDGIDYRVNITSSKLHPLYRI